MLQGEEFEEVKLEQLDAYLAANHRNVGSLLAAYRLTHDNELLREAAEKFPNEPRLAYESWFRTQDKAERQRWLETWEASDPNNALASYLAAANLFKRGETDAAIQKLEVAATKSGFSYYARDTIIDCEEAYKAAGYPEAEAKMASTLGLLLPHLAELKGISSRLQELHGAYTQVGDEGSAQAILHLGMQMADRIPGNQSCLIEELVKIAIESNLLKPLNPASPSGVPGKSAQEILAEGAAQRESYKALGKQTEAIFQDLPDEALAAYCDRFKMLGEREAVRWLIEKFGTR